MAENSAQAAEYAAEYAAEGGAAEYAAEGGAAAEGEAAEYAAEAERVGASQLTDDDEGSAKETQSKMAEVSAEGEEASEEEIQRMMAMTGEFAAEGGAESDENQKDAGDDSDDAADDGEDGLYQEDISNDYDGQLDAPDDGTTSDGVGVSMAQISSSDDDFQNDDFLAEILHGDNFQTGCVTFSKALVAHSSGNKKKVNSQMELVCSSLKFAVDVDMCQRYQSTIMGHLHKKAAWNMNSMDFPLFCKGMIKVKAEQQKELAEAQVAAKKYNAALKAGIAGIAIEAPAPLLVKASLKEVGSLKAWEQKWGVKAKL